MIKRLENISGNKFAVVLCSHTQLKNTIFNVSKLPLNTWEKFNEWKLKVQEHFFILRENYPYTITPFIPEDFINFTGIQMLKWAHFHNIKFDLPIPYAKNFLRARHFSENGIVNREIAARDLVKDENLYITVRFKIACYYFFEDIILDLWKRLSGYRRSKLMESGGELLTFCIKYLEKGIESCFTTNADLQSYYSQVFKLALNTKSEVAAKYCWNRVDSREREYLSRFAVKELMQKISLTSRDLPISIDYNAELFLYFEPYVEMFKFLYHELGVEKFRQLFYQFDVAIMLEYFLHCPYQDLFVVIADLMWNMFSTNSYCDLLKMIVYKMKSKIVFRRDSYKELFRKMWIQSPPHYKSYVFQVESDSFVVYRDDNYIISALFNLEKLTNFDIETLQLIFEDCNCDEKKEIIRVQGICLCLRLLINGKLLSADLFINFLPDDMHRDFKRKLLSTTNLVNIFWGLLAKEELELSKEEFNWDLNSEEIEILKYDLLNLLPLEDIVNYFYDESSRKENIDKVLNWILSADQVAEFKKSLVFDTYKFIDVFKFSIIDSKFKTIDKFLLWIFQTKTEINLFKANLAFEVISCSFYIHVRSGFHSLNKFIKWSEMNKYQIEEFKYKFAFSKSTLRYFEDFIKNCNFHPIDDFINWSHMTEDNIKEFKKILLFSFTGNYYSTLIICGKAEKVDFALEWSELSGKDLQNFRRGIRTFSEKYTFDENVDLKKLETREEIFSLIKWCQSSEEDFRSVKTKIFIALKNLCISFANQYSIEKLEVYVDIFLKQCQFSEKEIKEFKIFLLVNENGAYFFQKLIKRKKWNDIRDILKWTCLTQEEIKQFKRELFEVSKNLCLGLAIRGCYDHLNVFLTCLEIDKVERHIILKEAFSNADIIYRFIFKNAKKKKRVKKRLENILGDSDELKEFQIAFLVWIYRCWKHRLCIYCKDIGKFILTRSRKTCYHCSARVPIRSKIDSIILLINKL